MLACHHLDVFPKPGAPLLVRDASARWTGGQLHALIGPSGCGKTTLLKGMLGILPARGEVSLRGQTVAGPRELLRAVAFAPQFSIAHGKLTVGETIDAALRLYQTRAAPSRRTDLLQLVGLEERADTLVEKLSGGQLRRLGLALELTTDPACLLCDEVTSGLDPRSEDQILALLRSLVAGQGRTVICVIHNLAKLTRFDTVTVVYEGAVVFQGTLAAMLAHFAIDDALLLYDRLAEHPLDYWLGRAPASRFAGNEECRMKNAENEPVPANLPCIAKSTAATPGPLRQTATLLRRRWRLFMRDRGYLALTLAITFGFPCLVVIFALGGLPQMKSLSLEQTGSLLDALQERAQFRQQAADTAMLVSGLIVFQVILLSLMGSNNGAREIAGERALYEKERMAGLRPAAYAVSKLLFALFIGAAQGAWMTVFVKTLCDFPGHWLPQLGVLSAVGASMSVVCLGLSAVLTSPDKASLLSIYLVGFQLPLSGVVLALPSALVWAVRPFIATYWGWSGYLTAMNETRFYDAVVMLDKGWLAPPPVAAGVLGIHAAAGAALVFWGCSTQRWP
ncbi:MAG: ATP-binding cassette domain-containing protein [Opitutaceae bacterium]|nr:ATP-binding cassette domain-containing protein [Opitutaceae bacterium]